MKDRLGHGSNKRNDPFSKHQASPATALPTLSPIYTRVAKSGRNPTEYCITIKQGSRVNVEAFRSPDKAKAFARSTTLDLLRRAR